MRVLLVGATGYIGRHVVAALSQRGHDIVALTRRQAGIGGRLGEREIVEGLAPAEVRFADVTDPASVENGLRHERFDAVVSCLASRTGAPKDAHRIDYQANLHVLRAAAEVGASTFVLLSAICVQKPRLAFQREKLAFESELSRSGLRYRIVRPTAFFKSLSGQVKRVRAGKPFLLFGDGRLTACKPISERDLASFMAEQLDATEDLVLPIGGPGEAISPKEQAELLFELAGNECRTSSVSPRLLQWASRGLDFVGGMTPWVGQRLKDKAELARIGHYYATESMLVWDAEAGRYDAGATPAYGTDTLREHYLRMLRTEGDASLGDHAVF